MTGVLEPLHIVIFLAGVPAAIIIGLMVVFSLGKIVEAKLSAAKLVTADELEKYIDIRMAKHEEWEARLNTTSRDILRELIESYHRQGLDAVEQARRLAVRVATDSVSIQTKLDDMERRLTAIEKEIHR